MKRIKMKNKELFRIFRVIFYILAFLYLLFSEVKEEYSFIICPSKSLFDVDCYLCGMTRAFISIFHFNFLKAIELNPLVIVFYPLLVLLAIQDTFVIIKNKILKKDEDSYLEFLIRKV